MVAFPRVQNLNRSILPFGGPVCGLVAAAAFALMPKAALESLIWGSGITALVPAAEPPLGVTARAVLATGVGGIVAAIVWAALYLLLGPGGLFAPRRHGEEGVPVVRRADAHPDAPPRRPLFAQADLGPPMMDVRAVPDERPLPQDLDLPLAVFDPQAIPAAPMEPVRPVAPLAIRPQTIDPGDRFETFELTPVVRSQPVLPTAPASPPSIDSLVRRLEQGARRREGTDWTARPSLQQLAG